MARPLRIEYPDAWYHSRGMRHLNGGYTQRYKKLESNGKFFNRLNKDEEKVLRS